MAGLKLVGNDDIERLTDSLPDPESENACPGFQKQIMPSRSQTTTAFAAAFKMTSATRARRAARPS